jgi:hypothetical protein
MLAHSWAGMMRGIRSNGNQALGARAVFVLGAIHREGDAHAAEDHLGLFAPRLHHVAGWRASHGVALVVVPDLVAAIKGQLGTSRRISA